MIKQLLNSAIAKYRDLSVARRSINCLCLWHRQIIDLLATDKLFFLCCFVFFIAVNICKSVNIAEYLNTFLIENSHITLKKTYHFPANLS